MKDKKDLIAPCGLDCFNCDIYKDNLTSELAGLIQEKLGVAAEDIPCHGCRQEDGKHFHIPPPGCETLQCAKSRGVELCCYCEDFPCAYLAPTADGASRYPHNLKVYNLCRIKSIGLENWMQEAAENRRKYFSAKFAAGKGQAD